MTYDQVHALMIVILMSGGEYTMSGAIEASNLVLRALGMARN